MRAYLLVGAAAFCVVAGADEPTAHELVTRAKAGPCVLFSSEQARAVRQKIAADEKAKAWWTRFHRRTRRKLEQLPAVPDRGGQWPLWYSCRKCGASLKAKTPHLHVCGKCGERHEGLPYDDCYVMDVHNGLSAAVRDAGIAYLLSGEAVFAERARDVLLGYAGKYGGYEWHNRNGPCGGPRKGGSRLAAQVLDEAVTLIKFLEGYDAVRTGLSPEDRRRIEEGFIRASAETILTENAKWSNHECWHLTAYGIAGLVLGDEALVEKSLHSTYGAMGQLEHGVLSDGCWWEVSPHYHFYTVESLRVYCRTLANLGLTPPEAYRRMFVAPICQLGPDGHMAAINDSWDHSFLPGSHAHLYELAYSWWGDDLFGWWVNQGPRDSMDAVLWGKSGNPTADVRFESRRYDASGLGILRSRTPGFTGKSVGCMPDNCLILDYGPHGKWHGHPDKLNVTFWGRGKMLAEDPGCLGYGNPLHWGWYKSTLAHNTIRIDGRNQQPAEGRLLAWRSDGLSSVIVADAGPIAAGVTTRRMCALVDDVFLDYLWVESDAEHQYEWVFHGCGQLETSVSVEPVKGIAPHVTTNPHYGRDWSGEDSWSWVEKPMKGSRTGDWSATWSDREGVAMQLVQSSPPGELWTGVGGALTPPRKTPFVANRVRSACAAFPTVVTSRRAVVSIETAPRLSGGAVGFAATVDGRRYEVSYKVDGTCDIKAAEVKR